MILAFYHCLHTLMFKKTCFPNEVDLHYLVYGINDIKIYQHILKNYLQCDSTWFTPETFPKAAVLCCSCHTFATCQA